MTKPQRRTHHKRACANPQCNRISWTSVPLSKPYICASCKRAAGLSGTGKRGEGHYSTLAIPPVPVVSFGRCPSCKRYGQRLINNRCECCNWYDDTRDIDAGLSARGRSARGGVNDFVKKARS